jgi:hypothetical protein
MACGRPFLVDGVERLASPAKRDDYAEGGRASTERLTPVERRMLERHWTEVGLMEHASIAAFARFALQLLQLGAPASLVDAAQRALGDELVHARLAFGLARTFAGSAVGPGALPVAGALSGEGFIDIVRTAFREACVGETLAACEAIAARDAATDPALREVLSRIAEDESRHAALGFEFIKWALQIATPRERTLMSAFFRAELDTLCSAQPVDPGAGVPSHGLLAGGQRREARRSAVRDVLLPCVSALLASLLPAPLQLETSMSVYLHARL